MRNCKRCITEMLVLCSVSLIAHAQKAGQAAAAQPSPAKHLSTNQAASEGERVFAQNCSRCHTAPDGFSPRISGTIAMHMRVRASLSKHDTQELLRFLNP